MIDILKIKESYKEYISNYNTNEPRIALKIAHIYRTAEKSKWLAEKLQLEKEDVLLAEFIGLLHDIGRFEQSKANNDVYDNADSTLFDHAIYGCKVLFEDNMIRRFIDDNKYDNIKTALI